MFIVGLTVAALAAPPGFKVTKNTEHCELSLGEALPNGVVPMRAECHWPDLAPERLHTLFAAWADHDLYFSTVQSSELLRTDGRKAWVQQVHASKGIAEREAILMMERTELDGGGARYAWTLDNAGLEVGKGRVEVGYDNGFWEIRAHPDGGTSAIHQLSYDPGGSVPGFLVRWFQTSGLQAVVEEIEAYARKG